MHKMPWPTGLVFCVGAFAAIMPVPGAAQIVVNADMTSLQPTVMRDERGFKSCGVRVVSVVGASGNESEAYDFSVNIYPDSVTGMIKAGKYTRLAINKAKQQGALKAVLPPPISFWVARADQAKPVTPKLIVPAESLGFILGGTEFGPTLEAMVDIANGARMQFVTHYRAEKIERVISFSSKMAPEDLNAFNACLAGMHSRLAEVINASGDENPPPQN